MRVARRPGRRPRGSAPGALGCARSAPAPGGGGSAVRGAGGAASAASVWWVPGGGRGRNPGSLGAEVGGDVDPKNEKTSPAPAREVGTAGRRRRAAAGGASSSPAPAPAPAPRGALEEEDAGLDWTRISDFGASLGSLCQWPFTLSAEEAW